MKPRSPGPLEALSSSWIRSLRARNLSATTLATYRIAADQLDEHLAALGVPDVESVRREHVEDFISTLISTRSAATASVRYRSLQQLFNWLVEEEEIDRSPMPG